MSNLSDVKAGDTVIRNLAGIEMPMQVTEVTGDRIKCGGWEFCRLTGAEIDDDLGWGPQAGHTGSFIKAAQGE